MFIFYKSYFEGEEMVTGFPLRGKELEEDERVMSSSSSGGGSGGGTGGGGGSSGNGCGGDREGDTNERPPKVQGVETAGFRPPLKIEKSTRVVSTGSGWLEAGGLRMREVGVGEIPRVDLAGGGLKLVVLFAGVERGSPWALEFTGEMRFCRRR